MSKQHPHQGRIVTDIIRTPGDQVGRVGGYPTTQLADSGGPVGVVAPPVRALSSATEVCGTAVTVWVRPGDILYALKATDYVGEGDVLVVDGGGREDAALLGDFVAREVARRGCRGIVVDGAVRDLEGIEATGVPVFARGTHPATATNTGPGAINVPVSVGGVPVQPGDVVRADSNGVVVVPEEHVTEVLKLTGAVAEKESSWQAAMERGQSMVEAIGLDELILRHGYDLPR